ncbi:Mitochondrial distribution and morphology protein 12 [Podochytrium sp. JEL0797]|nr:Mitochondrial distribution and morphology protein 12 [Podochytrium sp. JEL0797]
MSFDIQWDKLRDGELAQQLQDWINERLEEMDDRRPSFLGKLSVTDLDFGSIPPVVAIQDITNVIDEFYLPDDVDIFSQTPSASNLAHLLAPTFLNDRESSRNGSEAPSSASPQRLPSTGSPPDLHQRMPSKTKSTSVEDIVAQYAEQMRRETDLQIEIFVEYKGDCKLSISTALIVNQPTPAFITLPLVLTLTGFSFTAVAVISYLGDHINFCFKENGENRGLFNEINIDSEIGDKTRPQGVLKNVGKIEKFIVDQVKTLVSDHLVYPNYHCLSLINENGDGEDVFADDGSEVLYGPSE